MCFTIHNGNGTLARSINTNNSVMATNFVEVRSNNFFAMIKKTFCINKYVIITQLPIAYCVATHF